MVNDVTEFLLGSCHLEIPVEVLAQTECVSQPVGLGAAVMIIPKTANCPEIASAPYDGPECLALADWRQRIGTLYAEVRSIEDPKRAWLYWCAARSALFRDHPMSPLTAKARKDFWEIPVFDYDPTLRFEVDVTSLDGPVERVMLGADGEMGRRPLARTYGLEGQLGAELILWWIQGYGGGLFLPFQDATNGRDTYGGGRYLIDAIKSADLGLTPDGRLILDFNFSYHPSCAFNDAWVCPLAPTENTLPLAVRAGERLVEAY